MQNNRIHEINRLRESI